MLIVSHQIWFFKTFGFNHDLGGLLYGQTTPCRRYRS
jgi:hypothetical protein